MIFNKLLPNTVFHRSQISQRTSQSGFTLLELLVVVSIIGILIALIAAGFSTAQSRGRDARRRGDIKSMQSGFEQYYAVNNGSYNTCVLMATAAYLPAGLPLDPQTGTAYSCTGSATTYCTCGLMEGGSGGNASNSTCTFVSGASGTYFCAQALQ